MARISILINGSPKGYFKCSRWVRQGDHLSPLLFGIVEEFLSRYLLHLTSTGDLAPSSSPWGSVSPTHLLYADDVLLFCKGTMSNLKVVTNVFNLYGDLSG